MSRPLEHLPRTLWSKRVFCLDIKKNTIIREGRQKKKEKKKLCCPNKVKCCPNRVLLCSNCFCVGLRVCGSIEYFFFLSFLFYFIVDVIVGNPINLTVGTKF